MSRQRGDARPDWRWGDQDGGIQQGADGAPRLNRGIVLEVTCGPALARDKYGVRVLWTAVSASTRAPSTSPVRREDADVVGSRGQELAPQARDKVVEEARWRRRLRPRARGAPRRAEPRDGGAERRGRPQPPPRREGNADDARRGRRGPDRVDLVRCPPGSAPRSSSFFAALDGPRWPSKRGWTRPGSDPCFADGAGPTARGGGRGRGPRQLRTGVLCEEGRVAHIDLSNNRLRGTLPGRALGARRLRTLTLANAIAGSLPREIGALRELPLALQSNALEGSIPAELGRLVRLEWLSLHHNRFSGALPAEAAQMASLRSAFLQSNAFSGAAAVAGLGPQGAVLETLQLQHNALTDGAARAPGQVPVEGGECRTERAAEARGSRATAACGCIPRRTRLEGGRGGGGGGRGWRGGGGTRRAGVRTPGAPRPTPPCGGAPGADAAARAEARTAAAAGGAPPARREGRPLPGGGAGARPAGPAAGPTAAGVE